MYNTIEAHEERNKAITLAILAGASQTKLAKKYELSKSRINQVTWKTCYHAWPEVVGPLLDNGSSSIKSLRRLETELSLRVAGVIK